MVDYKPPPEAAFGSLSRDDTPAALCAGVCNMSLSHGEATPTQEETMGHREEARALEDKSKMEDCCPGALLGDLEGTSEPSSGGAGLLW